MKAPSDLSDEELIKLVQRIRELAFLDMNDSGEFWNRDKELGADFIEHVCNTLDEYGLAPDAEKPVYEEPSPGAPSGKLLGMPIEPDVDTFGTLIGDADIDMDYCDSQGCEAEATTRVPVSVNEAGDEMRDYCDSCNDVYCVGVQHGRYYEAALRGGKPDFSK